MRYSVISAPSARADPLSASTYATNGVRWIRRAAGKSLHRTLRRSAPCGRHVSPVCGDHPLPPATSRPAAPEPDILAVINRFFNSHVFGTDRLNLATTSAGISAQQAAEEHREKIAAAQRAPANIETTRRRVFRVLERGDDPDGTPYQQAVERNRELDHEYAAKAAELAQLEQAAPPDPAGHVDPLSELPQMEINSLIRPRTGSGSSSTRSPSRSSTTSAGTTPRS
jgi:hypothetical protein